MKLVIFAALCVATAQSFEKVAPANVFGSRIVGGFDAEPEDFPWQVALQLNFPDGSTGRCGGSIISNRWILTAAACVAPSLGLSSVSIGFGSDDWNTPLIQMISTDYTIHPEYNSTSVINNVALIQLPAPIGTGATIQPIRLAAASQESVSFNRVQGTVTGFGKTSDNSQLSQYLMWTNVSIITNSACAAVYGTDAIVASAMCAQGFNTPTQSTCGGDTGSALFIREGSGQTPTQIGVASFVAAASCEFGFPSGYARTASFVTWIGATTGIPVRP